MSTGELGGALGDDPLAPALPGGAQSVSEILELVDRILAEPGRRSHVFGWLRRPGGSNHDWLPVEAYYPASRLVVISQDKAAPYRDLFAELVPAHGLRLLEIGPQELGGGRSAARGRLERRLAELGPPRGRSLDVSSGGGSWVDGWANATFQAPGHAWHRLGGGGVEAQPGTFGARGERQIAGILAGIALVAVLVAEVYAGVASAGFDSGHVLLAFGLALDACSRGLGTLAAGRSGSAEWAWWSALGGSPVVVIFALFQRTGPVRTEPAPLAGLIGVLALLVLAVALVSAGL